MESTVVWRPMECNVKTRLTFFTQTSSWINFVWLLSQHLTSRHFHPTLCITDNIRVFNQGFALGWLNSNWISWVIHRIDFARFLSKANRATRIGDVKPTPPVAAWCKLVFPPARALHQVNVCFCFELWLAPCGVMALVVIWQLWLLFFGFRLTTVITENRSSGRFNLSRRSSLTRS